MSDNRIAALRRVLEREGLAAWVAFDADPHGSEYVAERFRARSWLSGFRGSAGTLVVTADNAGLWTDSRYYLEAEEALAGTEITLFRSGLPEVPDYPAWLAGTLAGSGSTGGEGLKVGVDSACTSLAEFRRLRDILAASGVEVVAGGDLLDSVWEDRPGMPQEAVRDLSADFTGEPREARLERVRARLRNRGASALLLSSLDDIAWVLNLRGADVPYNPVFLSFLLIGRDSATLFVDPAKLDDDLRAALEAARVSVQAYAAVFDAAASLSAEEGACVLLSPDKTSVALRDAIPESAAVKEEPDVTTTMKARKSETEVSGVRNAMRRDGRAMVRFLRWLEAAVADARGQAPAVTEQSAAETLHSFRAEEEYFAGPSFPTISAFAGHGAIVHYSVNEESNVELGEGMYLVDSGGQYLDGTTDITRTVWFGDPPPAAREDFTLVLKAHIALATVRYPKGTTGTSLDAVARDPLWRHGRTYGHGTGHGVGCYLNVHEGPQRLAPKPSTVALEPGMISSNEPGLYRAGNYGVRIENLVLTIRDGETDFGAFYAFETLTLCPIDTRLVEPSLLSEAELDWLNAYHRRVYEELSPMLEQADRAWLEARTRRVTA
ncbi:MAG: aminopeptidase P family protein [Spirochaetales bacterium]